MPIFKKFVFNFSLVIVAAFFLLVSTGCDDTITVIYDDFGDDFFKVVFDDFCISGNDTDYTIQNVLGAKLGKIVGANPDSNTITWGGGHWFAYASGNTDGDSACIYSFDKDGNPDTIVTLAGIEPFNLKSDPLKMFGDDSLTVVLDARDAASDNESGSYYYAAIGCAIAGDMAHLTGATGYEIIVATDTGASSSVNCITWDLSNLVSVTIKGKFTGAFTFNFSGVTADKNIGVAFSKITSPDPVNENELQPLYETIPITSFVPAWWNGSNWDDIKANCHEIAIELNTDATAGGDFASLKLEKILFNFDTQANSEAAFPFLAN